MGSTPSSYELRIRPNRKWLRIGWKELWEYRDLLVLLVRRDLVSKYTQTILGPLWFVVQPVLTTLTFTIVFGKMAKISTDSLPPTLFYLCGMLPWNYFANTYGATASTFSSNAGLFGKVYFPRLIVPLAAAISNLFALAVQFAVYILLYLYYSYCTTWIGTGGVSWNVFFLPLVIAQVGMVSLGLGLCMSALSSKYKDFNHISGFVLSILFYATPVIFPMSIIPAAWRWLALLSPLSFTQEAFRFLLLGEGYVTLKGFIISSIGTIGIFTLGILSFKKSERTFVDTV